MIIKYGTFIEYRCKLCRHETTIAYHLKDNPPLEKYANYCIQHEWEDITGELHGQGSNTEESPDLQFSRTRS